MPMKTALLLTLLAAGSALSFTSVNAQPLCTPAPSADCGGCGGDKDKKKEKKEEASLSNCCDKGCGGKEKKTDGDTKGA